eukprot:TRINITY_DN775_c0_g1_i1.p2 TRINITY_DN775_c0_g1~~TRINITY_DN775_c0_g1_i1.p2  ORF type:complete len:609 (-),score=111.96 TRINITY_DN775_c0_g1_i1:2844-4670(-)
MNENTHPGEGPSHPATIGRKFARFVKEELRQKFAPYSNNADEVEKWRPLLHATQRAGELVDEGRLPLQTLIEQTNHAVNAVAARDAYAAVDLWQIYETSGRAKERERESEAGGLLRYVTQVLRGVERDNKEKATERVRDAQHNVRQAYARFMQGGSEWERFVREVNEAMMCLSPTKLRNECMYRCYVSKRKKKGERETRLGRVPETSGVQIETQSEVGEGDDERMKFVCRHDKAGGEDVRDDVIFIAPHERGRVAHDFVQHTLDFLASDREIEQDAWLNSRIQATYDDIVKLLHRFDHKQVCVHDLISSVSQLIRDVSANTLADFDMYEHFAYRERRAKVQELLRRELEVTKDDDETLVNEARQVQILQALDSTAENEKEAAELGMQIMKVWTKIRNPTQLSLYREAVRDLKNGGNVREIMMRWGGFDVVLLQRAITAEERMQVMWQLARRRKVQMNKKKKKTEMKTKKNEEAQSGNEWLLTTGLVDLRAERALMLRRTRSVYASMNVEERTVVSESVVESIMRRLWGKHCEEGSVAKEAAKMMALGADELLRNILARLARARRLGDVSAGRVRWCSMETAFGDKARMRAALWRSCARRGLGRWNERR